MTYQEIANMIASFDLPFAYYQFPDGTDLEPPFVCFYTLGDNDVKADDQNYVNITRLVIELYTDYKDFNLEQIIRAVLNEHGLVFSVEEAELDTEKMHMTTFMTEVIVNG